MSVVALSIDYKKASIDVRSAFALDAGMLPDYLQGLQQVNGVEQCVILSTCNRTEIYLVLTELKALDAVIEWWQSHTKSQAYELKSYINVRQGSHVAHHLMKLACGLESMVVGEPQILGQIKDAYAQSLRMKTLGGALNRLFQKVFSVAKRVRTNTRIGECPVSVAFSAVTLARQSLDNFQDKVVLVIGAGVTGALVARHMAGCLPKALWIANRTLSRAQTLAQRENGEAYDLSDIQTLFNQADIVVTAVSAEGYKLKANMLHSNQTKVLVDLSVPMAIDPELARYENVTLYSVDDIQGLIKSNKQLRAQEGQRASKLIEKALDEYINKENSIVSNKTITALRAQADEMIDQALTKSVRRLNNGDRPEEVLARFAHELRNKWLHQPSVMMKNASAKGELDLLDYAQQMFGLNMDEK